MKDSQLFAMHERTFGGRSIRLEFDRWGTSEDLDERLFMVSDESKVKMASREEYLELRQRDALVQLEGGTSRI